MSDTKDDPRKSQDPAGEKPKEPSEEVLVEDLEAREEQARSVKGGAPPP